MAQSYHADGGKSTQTYTFTQKWGDDPFTALGYAQIPMALFRYGARLGIAPDEGYLICHIWQFKWSPSDEGPSEKLLAERFGKSDDTVRKLLHRLEAKGFLEIERQRGELGYYTHTVYDFRRLRDWLNECYWQDHPQERPKARKPRRPPAKAAATPQIRGVVKQQRKTPPTLPAERPLASPQNGGVPPRESAGTLIDLKKKKESEEADFSPSSLSEGKEPEGSAPGAPEGTGPGEKTGPREKTGPKEGTAGPEEAWRAAYRSLSDRERQGWGRKATLQAAGHGLQASNVPAISRLARELFREHFEREHFEREHFEHQHSEKEQAGQGQPPERSGRGPAAPPS